MTKARWGWALQHAVHPHPSFPASLAWSPDLGWKQRNFSDISFNYDLFTICSVTWWAAVPALSWHLLLLLAFILCITKKIIKHVGFICNSVCQDGSEMCSVYHNFMASLQPYRSSRRKMSYKQLLRQSLNDPVTLIYSLHFMEVY